MSTYINWSANLCNLYQNPNDMLTKLESILECIRNIECPQIAKTNVKRNNKVGRLTCPGSKTCNKAIVIKTVWCWHKDRHIDLQNSIEKPEINLQIYSQIIFKKNAKDHSMEKEASLHHHPSLFSSVQFSHSVVSDSLSPHESQHARPPCPSPTPGVCSIPCPSSWWRHPAISSSVVPFSSCPQSLPASGSFPVSQLFAWGGQSIGVSALASLLPMNTQDWSPLGWTGWISLLSKGLSRVFSNTTVQKHQFFQCSAFFTVQLSHPCT